MSEQGTGQSWPCFLSNLTTTPHKPPASKSGFLTLCLQWHWAVADSRQRKQVCPQSTWRKGSFRVDIQAHREASCRHQWSWLHSRCLSWSKALVLQRGKLKGKWLIPCDTGTNETVGPALGLDLPKDQRNRGASIRPISPKFYPTHHPALINPHEHNPFFLLQTQMGGWGSSNSRAVSG